MPQRLDYTILDRVVARKGASSIQGEIVSMELDEDYGFSYGPPSGIVNVTIRVGRDSIIRVNNSGWTIDRVVE